MTTLPQKTSPNSIPVSIVTGFLGSGKTTLIKHLVTQPNMDKTALIINEFGEIGLDNQLVETSIENALLLENGCICCSIRGDLIDTISDLFSKVRNGQIPQFNRILIETTGLANPGPIIESIENEFVLKKYCQLNNVVTMVDGVQGSTQILKYEESIVQIAQADIALISKCDLATEGELETIEKDIRAINPMVEITHTEHGMIHPDSLFRMSAECRAPHIKQNVEHHDHRHRHGDVSTWSLIHDAPIDEARLSAWLGMMFTLRPFAMLRMKGLVRIDHSSRPLLIQAVGTIFSPPVWLEAWPQGKPQTQLVMIFKELSPDSVKNSFHKHVLG